MKRRAFLGKLGAGAGAYSALNTIALGRNDVSARKPEVQYSGSGSRPNMIFLMDDQRRWDALGTVDPGYKTPHLDALARNGIHYDQAVCQAPICVPSRYSLMLGLYPSQTGMRTNQPGPKDEDMPCATLPELLLQAGYQTAGFGKTHWVRHNSSTRGFEVRAIQHERNEKSPLVERGAVMMSDNNPEGLKRHLEEVKDYGIGEENINGYIGCTSKVHQDDHPDGWTLNQALDFLDNGLDPKRPLFFYLSFLKPHPGFNVPVGFEEQYNLRDIPDIVQPPWEEEMPGHSGPEQYQAWVTKRQQSYRDHWSKASPEERRLMVLRYRANCTWIDSMFGAAIEKLREKGLLENSLIVYCSDHGEMLGERFYRFNKYCMYDAAVRVPMIVSGSMIPQEKRGTVDSRPAELVDILPTFLGAAGVGKQLNRIGASLLQPNTRTGNFCEYHGQGVRYDRAAPAYMWRTKDWKLILYMDGPVSDAATQIAKGELYNLRDDPKEWENLFEEARHGEVREELTRNLLMHLALTHARWPERGRSWS